MNEFNLPVSKVVSTITDNGSNFGKVFKEFGIKTREESEQLDEDDNASEPDCESDDDDDDDDIHMVLPVEDMPDNDAAYFTLSKHVRCASHTLSLVITTDAIKALGNSKFSTINYFTMGKCSALWNKSGCTKSAEIIKEIMKCSLYLPCQSRWNSLFDSLNLLVKNKEKLPDVMSALSLPKFKLNEIEFLEEVITILSPIATAIDRLKGDLSTFYGEFLPTLLSLQNMLDSLKLKPLNYAEPLLTAVVKGFEKRFGKYLNLVETDSDVHDAIIASTSHPYFKMRWIAINKSWDIESKESKVKRIIINAATAIHTNFLSQDSGSTETDTNLSKSTERDEYFGFAKSVHSGTSKVDAEIFSYLQDENYSIESLQKHPLICRLFLKYNTTLPSSGPVDRLFSFAGITLTPKRNHLSDSDFERLVLLRSNKKL